MSFRPLSTKNSQGQSYGQVNDMIRSLNKEQQVKTYNGANGRPAVTVGKLDDDEYGLSFSDGTTTFLRITKDGIVINDGTTTFLRMTKDGIVLNDGTHDRILIGKDVGGF